MEHNLHLHSHHFLFALNKKLAGQDITPDEVEASLAEHRENKDNDDREDEDLSGDFEGGDVLGKSGERRVRGGVG